MASNIRAPRRRWRKVVCLSLVATTFVLVGVGRVLYGQGPASSKAGRASQAQVPASTKGQLADWAVLLYMDADCNLEDATLGNLDEILQVGGSTAKVRVLALVDRSPLDESGPPPDEDEAKDNDDEPAEQNEDTYSGYTNRAVANMKDWSGAKLLEPRDGELAEHANWGDVNMGDPATLRRFIETAARIAPAKKHLLIFSDHGAGWQGVCYDDSADGDGLTIDEIVGVLRATKPVVPRWEMLGHDACLMGAFEVVEPLAEFSRVQVVSEELVPGDGWNYVTTLRQLNREPAMDGVQLGERIADSFQDYFDKANRDDSRAVTLSVVQSDALPKLASALGDFARTLAVAMRKDAAAWRAVARARARTEYVGSRDGTMLDLIHLAQLVKKEFDNQPTIAAKCDALIAATKAAVVHNIHGKDRPNANGLTVVFPATAEALAGDADDPASVYGKMAQAHRLPWFPMLAAYTKTAAEQPSKPILGEVRASARSVNEARNVKVTGSVDASEAQEVFFTVATPAAKGGGGRRILSSVTVDPEGDDLSEDWEGIVVALKGAGGAVVPLSVVRYVTPEGDDEDEGDDAKADPDADEDDEDISSYEAEVLLRRGGRGPWRPMTLVFDVDDSDDPDLLGTFNSAYLVDGQAGDQERVYRLQPGDEIRSVAMVLDDNGKPTATDDTSGPRVRIKKKTPLQLVRSPAKPGRYAVGFRAINLAGDEESHTVEVDVEAPTP